MADCRFVVHARGSQEGLDELLRRMTDWHHVPRCSSPCRPEVRDLTDGDRLDGTPGGQTVRSIEVAGICSFSMMGSFCRDTQHITIRSVGWGGTIGAYERPVEGEVTLGRTATELGLDIEGYSYHPDHDEPGDEKIWEHVWYSADGTMSVEEDCEEEYDEWGNVTKEEAVIPLVWHL